MAIDPKLVSIKQASDLQTAIPTAAGYFFYYEAGNLMKASMTELYDRLESAYLGVVSPSSTPPATGAWFATAGAAGTYTNWSGIVVSAGEMDIDPVTGVANNRVILEVNDGVATKRIVRVKGEQGIPGPEVGPINPKGEWAAGIYSKRDLVSYGGGSYISKTDGNGSVPTDVANWVKIAEKGTPGSVTVDGLDGILTADGQKLAINRVNAKATLDVSTKNPGDMQLPNTSGSTNTALFRVGYDSLLWDGVQLDVGIQNSGANEYPVWFQARNPIDFSVNRPIWINPNGGGVKIGPYIYLDHKQISVGRSPLGIMATFEGDVLNGTNIDGVIMTTNTTVTESGYHDIFGLSSQNTKQIIGAGLVDTGLRVGITGDAYSNNMGMAGTLEWQIGIRGRAGFSTDGGAATALVKHATGGYFAIRNETPGTTIERAYGVYVENNDASGGNILKRFGVFSAGFDAVNYFEGKVGIRTEAPTEALHVEGVVKAVEGLQIGENIRPASEENKGLIRYREDGSNHIIECCMGNGTSWNWEIIHQTL